MNNDKHAKYTSYVRYTQHGPVRVTAPKVDPKACHKCGKRHGLLQIKCK